MHSCRNPVDTESRQRAAYCFFALPTAGITRLARAWELERSPTVLELSYAYSEELTEINEKGAVRLGLCVFGAPLLGESLVIQSRK